MKKTKPQGNKMPAGSRQTEVGGRKAEGETADRTIQVQEAESRETENRETEKRETEDRGTETKETETGEIENRETENQEAKNQDTDSDEPEKEEEKVTDSHKKNPGRASYGYIKYRKKTYGISLGICVAAGLVVLLVGLILNNWELKNIFTVLAVLFVLPAARTLTALILMLPYHTPDRNQYEEVVDKIGGNGKVLADLVFTSPEQVMHLDYLVLAGSQAWGYEKKQEKHRTKGKQPHPKNKDADRLKREKKFHSVEAYLDKHFKNNMYDMKTKVYFDYDEFLRVISAYQPKDKIKGMEAVYKSMLYMMP